MKRKTILWIVICCLIIIGIGVAIFLLVRPSQTPAPYETGDISYNVYFLNKTKDALTEEIRIYNYQEENIEYKLIGDLIAGPTDTENNMRAIGSDVKVLNIQTKDEITTVNFSSEFGEVSENDTLLASYTVVKTLSQLEGVSKVMIEIDGKPLTDSSGEAREPFTAEDIVIASATKKPTELTVTLYFYDENVQYLMKEERSITASNNDPIEKYVVEELIKGPTQSGLIATLDPESKLISVQTKDKTCFVNFTADFIDKNTGGSTKEEGAIYSIVNSLTELDGIENVQFLIEGKKVDTFGSFAFNEPFERDNKRIQQ